MKNVVIFYNDQLKTDVLSCYGGREISTPNIDRIAENGVKLTNFYTPSAVCTPSRGCFMTGRYPHNNGAYKNGESVFADEKGFANVFGDQGYTCAYIGKWHLAKIYDEGKSLDNINNLGFNHWKNKVEYGHCKSLEYVDGVLTPSREIGDENSYTTDFIANEAVEFLENQDKNEPFLLCLSIPDPHQPFNVRAPFDKMYDPEKMEIPASFNEQNLPDWAEYDTWGRNHYFPVGMFERAGHLKRLKAQYFGEVSCIDYNVGKVLDALKANGLDEDTIVVFTADHGDYLGEHGLMEKNNLYDSVYRVPMIISGVENVEKSTTIDGFMNVVDFGKTIATLAGVTHGIETHGFDKSDLIYGTDENNIEEIHIYPSDVPRVGIITREYELAYVGENYDQDRIFKDHILFDRINDKLQMNNLFKNPEYQDVIKELRNKMIAHHVKYGTPVDVLPKAFTDYM